jgi:hypothetical protein
MPTANNGIMRLVIKVTLTGDPSFDVQAGDKPLPATLDFFCNGGQGNADSSFLKEILGKIITSYPNNPISLCIDDPAIVPGALCGAGRGVSAPKSVAPKAISPKAAAPRAVPTKAAAPKAATRGTSPRKTSGKKMAPKNRG